MRRRGKEKKDAIAKQSLPSSFRKEGMRKHEEKGKGKQNDQTHPSFAYSPSEEGKRGGRGAVPFERRREESGGGHLISSGFLCMIFASRRGEVSQMMEHQAGEKIGKKRNATTSLTIEKEGKKEKEVDIPRLREEEKKRKTAGPSSLSSPSRQKNSPEKKGGKSKKTGWFDHGCRREKGKGRTQK